MSMIKLQALLEVLIEIPVKIDYFSCDLRVYTKKLVSLFCLT